MSKIQKLQGVKGMNDILPEQGQLWEHLEATLRQWLATYGYQNMRAPIVEPTQLFVRGIGEFTDVVEKEMFSFVDRLNGDELTLRTEFTAGIVRAAIEHSLTYNGAQRVFSMGPVFRHERPQKGRYRQFHQLSVEALGFSGPDMDAELICMLSDLWQILELTDVRLEINTLGQSHERQEHRAALIGYFEAHQGLLDDDAKRRLHTNPLRILDTKNPSMQAMVNGAPKLIDFLGDESKMHFETVLQYLNSVGVKYEINPRLVRGLDYYNHTVFEWVTDQLGAQGTICGGGRYDGLFEMLGGKKTSAAGFGLGLERLLALVEAQLKDQISPSVDVYMAHQSAEGKRLAFGLAQELRGMGLNVIYHCDAADQQSSMKNQMKKADAAGAIYALIIGEQEVLDGAVVVKHLRKGSDALSGEANQQVIARDKVLDYIFDQFGHSDHQHECNDDCDHQHTQH